MATEFLSNLLERGEIRLTQSPTFDDRTRRTSTPVLAAAFEAHRRHVAGPPIDFHVESAWSATRFLGQTAWYMMAADVVSESLPVGPPAPAHPSAAIILSEDLILRYALGLWKRARARTETQKVATLLENVLRSRPLTAAGIDWEWPPATDLRFDDHSGLQLLYVERWSSPPPSGWLPDDGPVRERYEWVSSLRQRKPTPQASSPAYKSG